MSSGRITIPRRISENYGNIRMMEAPARILSGEAPIISGFFPETHLKNIIKEKVTPALVNPVDRQDVTLVSERTSGFKYLSVNWRIENPRAGALFFSVLEEAHPL